MPAVTSTRARFRDPRLEPLWDKVRGGERLTREDGLLLFDTDDLHGLGRMADHVKRARHGDQVFFVMNRYVNPTNVCVLSCSFCDFARKPGEAGAFENSIEDVLEMIKPGTREAHIVGGHHPDWPFEYFERMIAAIHAARPETQIKAFTAAEIDYFWRRWKIEPRESLTRLKAAGLHSMPGGGAEIFSKRLAKLLHYTGKADADRWCEIHGIAHGLGHPHQRHHAVRPRGDARRSASTISCACASSRTGRAGSSPSSRSPTRSAPPSWCRARRRPPTTCAPSRRRGCSSTTSRTWRRTG